MPQGAEQWLGLGLEANGFMEFCSCFQIIPNFYPPLEAHVRQGVFNSLTHIVEKRVLA